MYAGKVVETGTSKDIFENPSHPYTNALLGLPKHDTNKEDKLDSIPGTPPDLVCPPKVVGLFYVVKNVYEDL